jgi:hypothetical protein
MLSLLCLICAGSLAAQTAPAPRGATVSPGALAWNKFSIQSRAALAAAAHTVAAGIEPAPAGVTDLSFSEFFAPIGDRGLEFTAKLRALAGKRVRLVGYMVREQGRPPGLFLFAGWPLVVETKGMCNVDDTPATTVHVFPPATATKVIPWRPGQLALIGTLDLGARLEADGRNSFVRLLLDAGELTKLGGVAAVQDATVNPAR